MFIDLTMPIYAEMPYNPDHFPPEISTYASIETHGWAASKVVLDSHLGTHMDAPFHFVKAGETIENIPLDLLIGPAQVIHLRNVGEKEAITPASLPAIRHSRVLLHMGWAERTFGEPAYFVDYPYLTPEAAVYLVENGVRLVGLDAPSVDYDPGHTHIALLSRGTVIIENLLNLHQLGESCILIALPLPIKHGDGFPIRAVARIDEGSEVAK